MNPLPEISTRVTRSRVCRRVWLAMLLFALCGTGWAEQSILVVQVKDIHRSPVEGVKIAIEGSSEPGTSDIWGRARIKLDPQTKVNDWVFLQIKSPVGRDLVLVSPWDGRTLVPPFEKESMNYVALVVVTRGDHALLGDTKALTSLTAKILKASPPITKGMDPEREGLDTIAKVFGLAPYEVDRAIRAWGQRTSDPSEKRLAALYEEDYPLASKDLNNMADRLREKGDYAGAEPLYQRTLAIDEEALGPDHPRVGTDLSNLALLLKAKRDYAGAEPLLRRALAIDEKALGPDHPDTRLVRENLAELLKEKEKAGQPK